MRQKKNFDINNATFIDLFAGIGGFRQCLGVNFGLKCVYSSEWDKYAQVTYKENFGEIPDGDITKVDAKTIPAHNILCGGFPCQAFSISGKQRGFEDTRGTLFFNVATIVQHHTPEILFLENVKNFASHDSGRTLQVVENTLKDLGYTVFYAVLNAGNFGVPTTRERIYIVGFREDLCIDRFVFPTTKNLPTTLRDFLEPDELTTEYIIHRNDIRLSPKQVEKDESGNYPQKPVRIGTINNGGQGERIYHDLGHAITLSAYGGGAASKTGAYLINGKVRKLSPRECARVMGYPDYFKIPVSNSQAYKQFGNSVAIPVLDSVFKNVRKALQ